MVSTEMCRRKSKLISFSSLRNTIFMAKHKLESRLPPGVGAQSHSAIVSGNRVRITDNGFDAKCTLNQLDTTLCMR